MILRHRLDHTHEDLDTLYGLDALIRDHVDDSANVVFFNIVALVLEQFLQVLAGRL
jgi:hypothetical protein